MIALSTVLTIFMVYYSVPNSTTYDLERIDSLDPPGVWEGIGWSSRDIWWVELKKRELVMHPFIRNNRNPLMKSLALEDWQIGKVETTDPGKIIISPNIYSWYYSGIYKWEGARLIISFGRPELGGVTTFKAGSQQWLLILRRKKKL